MDFAAIDFEALGIGLSIIGKSNPLVALATGVVSGVLGKAIFDKKKKSKEVTINKDKLLDLLTEEQKAKILANQTDEVIE